MKWHQPFSYLSLLHHYFPSRNASWVHLLHRHWLGGAPLTFCAFAPSLPRRRQILQKLIGSSFGMGKWHPVFLRAMMIVIYLSIDNYISQNFPLLQIGKELCVIAMVDGGGAVFSYRSI